LAVDALTRDDDLAPVFGTAGGAVPALHAYNFVTPIDPEFVPAGVVCATLVESLGLTGTTVDANVAATARDNVGRLRTIARGERVQCWSLIGVRGFSMPPDSLIPTRLGVLQGAGPEWEFLAMGAQKPTAVVLSPLTVQVGVQRPGKPPPKLDATVWPAQDRTSSLTRLALFLGCNDGPQPVRPTLTGKTVVLPYAGVAGVVSVGALELPLAVRDQQLTPTEISAVVQWAERLDKHHIAEIDIAIERTLLAATERIRPADILIDAVTAWENLAGTETESTFRVTAALACLLRANPDERSALYRKLKETYDVRSKVVHGEERSLETVANSARTALSVAKQALARVFQHEPWLLTMKKSHERADAILLGDTRLHRTEGGTAQRTGKPHQERV